MDFNKKVALITGASAGIGRAAAIKFAQCGAKVVIVDINEELLLSVKCEVEEYTSDVLALVCNVADEARVHEVISEVNEKFGGVDILVNNAGIWRSSGMFVDTPSSEWKKYIDVNILGLLYFSQAALPYMIEQKYGRIINLGSVAGVYGNGKMAHYSMTKGAVISFTKALAKEVAADGITVNCVSPGTVNSSSDRDYTATDESRMSYSGRTGSHLENAELIAFLASDAAAYINGQNIQIDGCRKLI